MASELNYDPAEFYRLCDALPDIGPCMKHGRMRCLECSDEFIEGFDDDESLDLGDCAEQMREDSIAEDEANSLEEQQ